MRESGTKAGRGRQVQERRVRQSLVVEARSAEQVYEVLSGLLDGVECAERTALRVADSRCRRDEMERIRQRYLCRTGEELAFEWTGDPPRPERGRVAVVQSGRPGEMAFGVVVKSFEYDSRLGEYLWSRGIPSVAVEETAT